jgi:uncharacterized repeat protein (TIGR04061 family)
MSLLSPAPVRIDAELYDDLSNPARQNAYPRESRGFVRIDVSLRTYWHALFDSCPQLLELSGPDGRAIYIPFMAWARERRLSFNWTYFLWVYRWLQQSEFKDRLTQDMLMPILTAAASRWIMLDRDTDKCMIVLGSRSIDGVVLGSKYDSLYSGLAQVEHLNIDPPPPGPEEEFGYFTLPDFQLDYFPGWRAIPR